MKVTSVEKKEKSTVELTIQVEAEAFEAAVQKAYMKNRNSINVPGFRKGKAPRKIIENMYGTGVFYEEAINEVYPEAYEAALKEQGLEDMGYPQFDMVEVGKEGLIFKALVSVRPEVKLNQYKGLTAPKAEAAVTEADVDAAMKPFIDRATRLVSVEREAQNGDTTVIDFEGFDNGVAFDGGKGENYELKLGSGSFVPGFEEQLVGMKAGDEKEINITFPEDYVPDLAGKAVVFKVKVNEVKESQAPEVDDEFAKDVSEFETLEAFRKDLETKELERREKQVQAEYEEAIMEQLVNNMEVEIPNGMVEVAIDRCLDDFQNRLASQGMTMDDYKAMLGGMNDSALRESVRPSAMKQVQLQLALGAVVEAEKLEVSDEEYEAEVNRLSEQYGIPADQIKNLIPAEDLKKDMCMKKASDLVLAEAKVGEAEVKAEEAPAEKPKRTRKKKAEDTEEPKAE